ncbi:MAG: type 4a pilus biogenesis protein PilO [Syntrophorhabdaceae bacterium]|nr:type 4a pilus biogenesis protein PilO [Syntrophorhabdaceae bacterium]MDD4195202.1 type 4a pilus biogenesis protein PilO [Syntrophorhabdaceae bacterium]HOC45389.1 type 4a pilus biogenesis protein PilO [Syntrophorhabdaceae bacterium]
MNLGFDAKSLGKKIEKVPQKYMLIVMVVLVLMIVGALYYFVMVPQLETKARVAKQAGDLRAELENLRNIKRNIAKHRQEYAMMQETMQEILKQLPESKDIPNLLRNVTLVSEETRLKVRQFEPKQIRNKDFYSELPFEMKFQGKFSNLASFLDGVRKQERIISVADFSFEAKGPPNNIIIEGSCDANAYMYLREPVKKAAEPAKGARKANVPPKTK